MRNVLVPGMVFRCSSMQEMYVLLAVVFRPLCAVSMCSFLDVVRRTMVCAQSRNVGRSSRVSSSTTAGRNSVVLMSVRFARLK